MSNQTNRPTNSMATTKATKRHFCLRWCHLSAGGHISLTIKWQTVKLSCLTPRVLSWFDWAWADLSHPPARPCTQPEPTTEDTRGGLESRCRMLMAESWVKKTSCLYFVLYWSFSYKALLGATYQRWREKNNGSNTSCKSVLKESKIW